MIIQDLDQVFIEVKLKTIRLILKDPDHLEIGTPFIVKENFIKLIEWQHLVH